MDLIGIIKAFGYLGVWTTIFLECAVLFFFFLPGDSLLIATGVLAALGKLDIWVLSTGCFIAAIAGNQVGYTAGQKIGPKLFKSDDARIFKRSHLERAHEFYLKHGGLTIIAARFIPILRTAVPFMAGAVGMSRRVFFIYSTIGAFIWTYGLTFAGYGLGHLLPEHQIEKYTMPAVLIVIFVCLAPAVWHWIEESRKK